MYETYCFCWKKKTNSFPDKQVLDLARERPELNWDIDYILLGTRREVFEAMEAEALADMPPWFFR